MLSDGVESVVGDAAVLVLPVVKAGVGVVVIVLLFLLRLPLQFFFSISQNRLSLRCKIEMIG